MSISNITIRDLDIQVTRKAIKNLHLGVYPPDGDVRVSAPLHLSEDNVRLAVIKRLGWIRKQKSSYLNQPRQSPHEMVTGESHYIWGKRYLLDVIYRWGKHEVNPSGKRLHLYVRPNTSRDNREKVLIEWYRSQVHERVPQLIKKWEHEIGVSVAEWGVRQMKTKWGGCRADKRRIWLNVTLAKYHPDCLEYVLVHEMLHLIERHHNEQFRGLLTHHLPHWESAKAQLNMIPLPYA